MAVTGREVTRVSISIGTRTLKHLTGFELFQGSNVRFVYMDGVVRK